ncbi:MAG: DUF3488 and transglutaminase-like domain-containing protein [Gulosibacter sp.]|uniref:DUF3488 and transglutaminase-like domain-containing protein n=1 Tax=Gulosibacter sp. TaxID=2817531 RepID=UPI003F8E10AD
MKERGSWFLTIGLMLLMCSGALLASPIVIGGAWLLPAMITIIVLLAVMQLSRRLTTSRLLGIVVGLIAWAIAGLVLAQPSGVTDIFSAVGRQITGLVQQLPSDQPPLRETPATIFVMAMAMGLLALIADLLASVLRAPATALITIAPIVVVPIAVGLEPASWWYWVLFAVITVLYLYLGHRWLQQIADEERSHTGFSLESRGSGGLLGTVGTGALTVLVALLIALLAPGPSGIWWTALGPNTSISTNRVNPIIDLGDDLRRNTPVEVLRYATSQTAGELPYLSLVTLSEFDAETEWQPGEFTADEILGEADLPLPIQDFPLPLESEDELDLLEVNSNIVMEQGVSAYLPHPSNPLRLGTVEGEYGWNAETGNIRNMAGDALAQSFHVDSVIPRPTEETLVMLDIDFGSGEPFAHYLELPEDPALDSIRAAMEEVVDPNATQYEKALQLQSWFTGGAFDYSEQAPVSGGYDGTSLEVINQFLQTRSGYCVHFSSTMAIMGRLLDIPTRIQVGFTPGTFTSVNDIGQPVYSVTTDNLHAWAEFYVPGYGWVPFETTPSSGIGETQVAEVEDPAETQAPPEESFAPTPTPTPESGESEPEPTDAGEEQDPTESTEDDSRADVSDSDWLGTAITIGAIVIVLLILAALVFLPRLLRARTTKQRQATVSAGEQDAAAAAWHEVLDTATDLQLRLPRGRTTGTMIGRLATTIGLMPGDERAEALRRLGIALDAAAFADPERPQHEPVYWRDVEAVRAGMLEHANEKVRRRAKWFPASVVSRRRK